MEKMGVGFRILYICGEIVDSEKTTVFVKPLNSFKMIMSKATKKYKLPRDLKALRQFKVFTLNI